jgi:hypothetical protein
MSGRLRTALGMWVFLMICHVYFTGVTLARSRLRAAAPGLRRAAWAPLGVMLAALAVVVIGVVQETWVTPVTTLREALVVLGRASTHWLPHVVLMPFVAAVRPLLANSGVEFARALPAAIALYAAIVFWVLRTDEAFDAAAEQIVERQSDQPVARSAYRARPIGWTLGLAGPPETAFVWKAALQTFRIVDRRVLMRFMLILLWIVLVVVLVPSARGFGQMLGVFAAIGSGFATLMAPQILRLDLRQDLQHLELLKTWPVRAGAVVRGEIIWPAAVITVIAWTLAALALFFSAAVFARTGIAWRMAVGLAAMILMPPLVFAQYTIHNATALLFPAWVTVGSGRPRGVDAMGQRLILLGGTWLMLVVSLVPGVVGGAIVWGLLYPLAGPWVLVPAALVCGAIVGVEVVLATEAMGPAYERLDITSVERPD